MLKYPFTYSHGGRVVPPLQLFLTHDDLTGFIESTTHIVGSKRIITVSTGLLIFIVG